MGYAGGMYTAPRPDKHAVPFIIRLFASAELDAAHPCKFIEGCKDLRRGQQMKNSACGGLLSCTAVVLESVKISERSRV